MSATDTADAALWLTGIVFWFWLAGVLLKGKGSRKWRDVPKHEEKHEAR